MLVSVTCDPGICWHGSQPELSHRTLLLRPIYSSFRLQSVEVASSDGKRAEDFFPMLWKQRMPVQQQELHNLSSIDTDSFLAWGCQLAEHWCIEEEQFEGPAYQCLYAHWRNVTQNDYDTLNLQAFLLYNKCHLPRRDSFSGVRGRFILLSHFSLLTHSL